MDLNLTNKVALITGSSTGIGAATATLFSSLGAKVIITGRKEEELAKVAQKCTENSPNHLQPLVVKADLLIEAEVAMLAEKTLEKHGRLDILVNNAGFGSSYVFTHEKYLEGFDKVMQLNLRSVVQLTHALLPSLKESKGAIVNVSSVASQNPFSPFWSYCLSKAALDMFTKCLAQENAPDVRVNSLNPGPVKTNFFENIHGGFEFDEANFKIPPRNFGTPDEMANIIAFLASGASSFMTGSIVCADGGSTILNRWTK